MRFLVRHWRGRGLKAIVYLDDGIISVKGGQRASDENALVRYELQCAGFVTNLEKSQWTPSKSLEWLGFIGEVSVPQNKLDALKSQLQAIAKAPRVPARQLASVIGKIMSMSLA